MLLVQRGNNNKTFEQGERIMETRFYQIINDRFVDEKYKPCVGLIVEYVDTVDESTIAVVRNEWDDVQELPIIDVIHINTEVVDKQTDPTTLQADDPVNHPSHYTYGKYEVIDVLEDWFVYDPLLWQVGKYLARRNHKGNILEDLKKARWYLDRKISKLEKGEQS